MFLLRDLPNLEMIEKFAARYPMIDSSAVQTLLYLLRTASDVLITGESNLNQYGISQGRLVVMMILVREPEKALYPSTLAEKAGVSRATMTGLIDGLERDGYVERCRGSEDRRSVMIHMTPKGQKFLDKILPDHFTNVSKLMSNLDSSERKNLINLLKKVEVGIQEFRKQQD